MVRRRTFGVFAVCILPVTVQHRSEGSGSDVPSGRLPRSDSASPTFDVVDAGDDAAGDAGGHGSGPDVGEDGDGFGQRGRFGRVIADGGAGLGRT
jgi:hypothetical protein